MESKKSLRIKKNPTKMKEELLFNILESTLKRKVIKS